LRRVWRAPVRAENRMVVVRLARKVKRVEILD
jgi:hypothetical protein